MQKDNTILRYVNKNCLRNILLSSVVLLSLLQLQSGIMKNWIWVYAGKQALSGIDYDHKVNVFLSAYRNGVIDESIVYGLAFVHIYEGNTAATLELLHAAQSFFPHSQRLAKVDLLANELTGDVSGVVAIAPFLGLGTEAIAKLANLRVAQKNWLKAITLFETARQLGGDIEPRDEFLLGKAHMSAGQIESAISSFQRVIADSRSDTTILSEAHSNVASVLFWRNPDEAVAHIRAAVQLSPRNVNALMTAGDFDFLQRADIDSMSNHYEQAIAIDANFAASWLTTSLTQTARPRDPRWFWLGVARDAIGDSCGAVGAYNHALDNVEDAAYRLNASQVKCTAS